MRYLLLCVCFVFACTETKELPLDSGINKEEKLRQEEEKRKTLIEQEKKRRTQEYIREETNLRTELLLERKRNFIEEDCKKFLFKEIKDEIDGSLSYSNKYFHLSLDNNFLMIKVTLLKGDILLSFIASHIKCYDDSNTVEFKFTDNTTHKITNEVRFSCDGNGITTWTKPSSKTYKLLTSKTIEKIRINGYKDSATFTIPLEKEVEDDLGRNTNIKEDFDIIDLNNLTLNIKRKAGMLSAEMIQKTLSCLNKESK